ncbi:unnamed protein product [Rodentolepis nana]|uniref:Dynactin domain-containing protein n=1 Tax=Rodentolepis nana TaxID=102285 RepID=A0A0R3TD59_RODNA|nr:unnamed protein product [Rodentolepis nana]
MNLSLVIHDKVELVECDLHLLLGLSPGVNFLLETRIYDLESKLQTLTHELEQQPPPSSKVNGVSVSVDAVFDKLAAAETRSEELVAEVKRLQSALGNSEALFTEEEKRSAQLSKS